MSPDPANSIDAIRVGDFRSSSRQKTGITSARTAGIVR